MNSGALSTLHASIVQEIPAILRSLGVRLVFTEIYLCLLWVYVVERTGTDFAEDGTGAILATSELPAVLMAGRVSSGTRVTG